MRAENQRPTMLISESKIAMNATAKASLVTKAPSLGMTPLSINSRSKSGEVTIRNASITTVIKKTVMYVLYGFA